MEKIPENVALPTSGQRGVAEHDRRYQIVKAADEHFRLYGYRKTSVADLGKAIGVSSTYIYRFFSSKQAIGEAVCSTVLGEMDTQLRIIAESDESATQRLRSFMRTAMERSLELFLNDDRLQELVVVAVEEDWCTASGHQTALREMIQLIVQAGRESGEFERKTPLDEVSRAIAEALMPFTHPFFLQHRTRAELEASLVAVGNLILRSLAP